MKDYIGKLIQRNQTSHASVRPRTVARFEPTSSQIEPESLFKDPGEIEAGFGKHNLSRPSKLSTYDSVEPMPSYRSRPVIDIEALHTIAIPRGSVTPTDAAQRDHGATPSDERPMTAIESTTTLDRDTSSQAKESPRAGFQVRPINIRRTSDPAFAEQSMTQRTQSTIQTQEPDINVTIGRVEVRAVMPREQRPIIRPKRTPPSLTLDDYLEKREA